MKTGFCSFPIFSPHLKFRISSNGLRMWNYGMIRKVNIWHTSRLDLMGPWDYVVLRVSSHTKHVKRPRTELRWGKDYANYHEGFGRLFRGKRMIGVLGELMGEDVVLFKEKVGLVTLMFMGWSHMKYEGE
jgi:hypothetical protein